MTHLTQAASRLQEAIFGALYARKDITDRLDGIYDDVPANQSGTYLTLETADRSPLDVSDRRGAEVSLTLTLWAEVSGLTVVHEMLGLIDGCLREGELALLKGEIHRITLTGSSASRQYEGASTLYRGRLTYRATVFD